MMVFSSIIASYNLLESCNFFVKTLSTLKPKASDILGGPLTKIIWLSGMVNGDSLGPWYIFISKSKNTGPTTYVFFLRKVNLMDKSIRWLWLRKDPAQLKLNLHGLLTQKKYILQWSECSIWLKNTLFLWYSLNSSFSFRFLYL